MIIAQISDLHISSEGSALDRDYCTAEHLAKAVTHLNALPQTPDFVIATGDLVDKGSTGEYERLRSLLEPLKCPVRLMIGNHDNRGNLRKVFADHDYLSREGFVHYTLEDGPVRVIALDTHIPGSSEGELCDQRLAWLEDRLAEAPDRPTIVAMHHPPFRTGLQKMDDMGLRSNEGLTRILAAHNNVERIICGHIHRPVTVRFGNTIASVCPSTAHQIALDLGVEKRLSVLCEPPACQLHVWGSSEGLVTHTSYIGDFEGRLQVFDGRNWISETKPAMEPAAAVKKAATF